jgi:hypothetical protein
MERLLADLDEGQRKLRMRAGRAPGVTAHAAALARLRAAVAARPRVVLLGEVNSGKTSLANRLLDQVVLPAGVVANTQRPLVLHYADTISATGITHHGRVDLAAGEAGRAPPPGLQRIEIGMPSQRLKSFDLVDTPGLADPTLLDTLPARPGDVLLWCTLATQAWKESERRLWMSLPPRLRRHAILVATHMDCLRDDNDVRKLRGRLAAEAAGSFRTVALVSATPDRDGPGPRPPHDDGLAELERQIAERLSAMARRRNAAAYRVANHIIRRALRLLEHAAAVSPGASTAGRNAVIAAAQTRSPGALA